jgi:hypothetical protein
MPFYGLRFQLLGRVIGSWIPWQTRYDWSRGTDAWGWGTPVRESVSDDERAKLIANAHAEYAAVLHDWKPSGDATAALRELLAVCQAHEIAVKLVMMPEGRQFRSWYSPAARTRLQQFAREFDVVNAQEWLSDEVFYDDHHQFRAGAIAFSERLTMEVIVPALHEIRP